MERLECSSSKENRLDNDMIIPDKLKKGDTIMVIAPSRSLSTIGQDTIENAVKKLQEYGLNVVFAKNSMETGILDTASIESKLEDLHSAFNDKNIKGIFTALGGYGANHLLKYIDYEMIKKNPKILCGFSDITILLNAIYTKTGLVGYYGPHFSTWAMEKECEYNLKYFEKCLVDKEIFEVLASKTWTDDLRFLDQNKRNILSNDGYRGLNEGEAEGNIVGGHLRCLNTLQGSEYMPSLDNTILFLEDDAEVSARTFDRGLQALINLPSFAGVKGMVIGKFQNLSKIDNNLLTKIIDTKKELKNIPIIGNANFGHTNPMITFPIGGKARIKSGNVENMIEILVH